MSAVRELEPESGYFGPASFGQERLHLVEMLRPGRSAYAMSYALRLDGPVEPDRVRRAVADIVARHDVLRSTFVIGAGELQVFVPDALPLDIPLLDLAGRGAAGQRAAVADELRRLTLAPFDLARGPLLRFSLMRLDESCHVLGAALHHIIADGQSLALFRGELSALLAGAAPLPELPIQYVDFADWERAEAERGEAAAAAYWTARLADAPSVLDLPGDFPRAPIVAEEDGAEPSGATAMRSLPSAVAEALLRQARTRRAPPASAFLAVLATLIARWTHGDDVVLAMPVSKRSRPELAGLIGLLVDLVPLRLRPPPTTAYAALLDEARDAMVGAIEHTALPFERIVELAQVERRADSPPFQQVLFGFEDNASEPAPAASAVTVSDWDDVPEQDAKSELSFLVERRDGEWRVAVRYDRSLFSAATAGRLLDWFAALCESAAARPEAPVGELALAPEAETLALLRRINKTARELPEPGSLAALFEAHAQATPGAPALTVFDDGAARAATLDYRTLNLRANRLAHYLAARRVGRGVRVALAMPAGAEFIVAVLAVVKLGAAFVPLDPALPTMRHTAMLDTAGVGLILTAGLELPRSVTDGRQVVDVLRAHTAIARARPENPAPAGGPDDAAYVMFTSGSTGEPKGVVVPQRAIVRLVRNTDFLQVVPSDSVGLASSVSFDASTLEIWGALLNGARLLQVPRDVLFSAAELAGFIAREGLSVLWVTKGLFDQLVRSDPAAFRGLRVLLSGGDAADSVSWRKVLDACGDGFVLLNGYGPTENTTFSLVWRAEKTGLRDPVPIGRPIANSRAYVLDAALRPVPPGLVGELYVAGLGLAHGYIGRSDLTAERFLPDPHSAEPGARMYHTGDLARLRDDGAIEFLGRIDNQVKIRGFRIELGEIAAALARHPSVAASHVAAEPAPEGDKRLVAYVVPRTNETLTADNIRDHLRRGLPDFMVPAGIVVVPALPLNANGKIDQRALARLAADTAETDAFAPPQGATEIALAEVFAAVLKLPRVGRDDNFFHLGGDSILGIRVVARARDGGVPITPRMLFQNPTIAGVAAAIAPELARRSAAIGARALPLTEPQNRLARLALAAKADAASVSGTMWVAGWAFLHQPIDAVAFGLTLEELRQRHDALRLRLAGDATVRVLEEIDVPPPVPVSLHRLRIPRAKGGEEAALAAAIAALGDRLDIEDGAVFRGALFEGPRGRQRLVVLAHRLVADEASVARLLDEVRQGIDAGVWGEEPGPAPPLLRGWIERVAAYAAGADLAEELAVWDDPARHDAAFRAVPSDALPGPREASCPLDGAVAARLAPAALAGRLLSPVEIVLAALAAALEELHPEHGKATLLIDVVTDGRVADGDAPAAAEMIGNLSRRFPVALAPGGASEHDRLARAKEAVRGPPRGGLGFSLLNHELGTLPHGGVVLVDGTAAGPVPVDPQHFSGAGVIGRPLVEAGERVVLRFERGAAGGLRLACTVRDAHTDPADLAGRVAQWIGRLTEDADGEPVYTPADFPRAGLKPETLRALLHGGGRVEDIYPVTPMQESMLVHALTVPGSAIGFEQACHRIDGTLDVAEFQAAWQAALDRHSILRTAFAWEGLARPLQIVHERVRVAFRLDDWSHLTPLEQENRREALLAEDRREGFRLDRAPLMRATIVRVAPSAFLFVSSYHHILLDGWCLPQLEREVRLVYEAGIAGRAHALPSARPYADYVAWLHRRSRDAARGHFESLFAEWPGPTPLPGAAPAAPHPQGEAARAVTVLSADETRALGRFARGERVTLGVVLHAAWGLVLMQGAGHRDVVFGTTVSGRPPELPGIESMIGLFINNLPVRLRINPDTTVGAMLAALQSQLVDLRQHEEMSPLEIEACVPGNHPGRLFDTLLVVENVPSALHEWESSQTLRFTLLSSSLRTGYALTLVAVPGDGLRLSLVYDPGRFAEAEAAPLLAEMRRLLLALAEGRDAAVAALLRDRPAQPAARLEPQHLPRPMGEDRVPPRSTVEVRVMQIVEEVLGFALPGVTQDLLACGMDSITVSRLGSRLRQAFRVALPLTRIIAHATVAELARLVAEENASATAWRPLVPLTRVEAPAFYCVHPIAGDVSVFLDLAREMAADRRFVALQSPGLGPDDPDYDSVAALAALYVDVLMRESPEPLTIGGYSFGGVVAFELARQLEAQGRSVRGVAIIDTPAPTGTPPPDEDYSDAQWLLRMLRVRERFHHVDLALTLEDLQRAGTPGCYDLVAGRLSEAGLLPEGADSEMLMRMTRVGQRHYAHYRAYRPGRIAAPLAVIRAGTLDASEHDIDWAGRFGLADLGWGELTAGRVLTAVAPGDHVTMMRPPAVADLARTLNLLLGSMP